MKGKIKTTKPAALKQGDTIGIISPSEPIAPEQRRKEGLQKGIQVLEDLGFRVVLARNALKSLSYMAGTPEERVADIHEMFANSKVKAIMCSWGGKSNNQLLDMIDYDLIARNPKVISGFSDPANLLNAIYAKTGLVTFYGPNIVGKLQPIGNTIDFFRKAVMHGEIGVIETSAPREMIKPGRAKGRLIGGNLGCFALGLLGTPFQPDFTGAILFWETGTNRPQLIDQYLTHYRLCGVFDKIAGMVIGYLGESAEERAWRQRSIKDTVLTVTQGYDFPVMQINSFGHGEIENITLPIGCQAFMDSAALHFEILETSVERAGYTFVRRLLG